MRAAFQMDPPASLNIAGDSTIALMQEAMHRGAECYYFTPDTLSILNGEVFARAQSITLQLDQTPWFQLGATELLALPTCDFVLIRQDPPFDMHYITATYMLEHLPDSVKVVNSPTGIRNAPEKLSALLFEDYTPPTLITQDEASVRDFAALHKNIIAKPLHGYGGHGVFQFAADDKNLTTFLEHWKTIGGEALVFQAFLPDVAKEECRILMVDGKIAGAFGRIPPTGSIRSNMRVGGTPVTTTLSAAQIKCCEQVGNWLNAQGIMLAGVDMIADHLIEINVTSPTGLRAVQQLTGDNIAAIFWDALT